ncbi:hypothetical protein AK812_SmicGene26478 [Symbiodinium microadriaticum]|uniref:Uncharacterized protein n=1 Tax=Symbiodinium microadriaticum TaxID=2951 RepID=A0A1Q9D9I8_SYMMI|nr:hypothetical protein AK812_SmicGene26478 [Symbiodinium microadriaticum]
MARDRGRATSGKPQLLIFDISSSMRNSGNESALMAIVQEMIRQREQDARERAEQLKTLKEKSVFTYSLQDDLPVLGGLSGRVPRGQAELNDREKLRLFASTLKGTRRRCYFTIVKEAKHNGDYEANHPRQSLAESMPSPGVKQEFRDVENWSEGQRTGPTPVIA